jgi:hypothetical protein
MQSCSRSQSEFRANLYNIQAQTVFRRRRVPELAVPVKSPTHDATNVNLDTTKRLWMRYKCSQSCLCGARSDRQPNASLNLTRSVVEKRVAKTGHEMTLRRSFGQRVSPASFSYSALRTRVRGGVASKQATSSRPIDLNTFGSTVRIPFQRSSSSPTLASSFSFSGVDWTVLY